MVIDRHLINKVCPYCSKTVFVADSNKGEIVCSSCGYVIKEKDESFDAEHIVCDYEDYILKTRAQRSAALEARYGTSHTMIGAKNTDYTGKVLDAITQDTVGRLRRLENRILVSDRRNKRMISILHELDRIKDTLSLSNNVVEEALRLYMKYKELKMTPGRYEKALLAAAVYAACKISGVIRSANEISSAMNLSQKKVLRVYRLLVEEVKLQVPLTDPSGWVTRIANKLGLDEATKRKALAILEYLKTKNFNTNRQPVSVAAAVIYLICYIYNKRIMRNDIAEAAGISEVTIRDTLYEIKEALGLYNVG